MPDISICVAVYKAHSAPNLASLATEVHAALDGLEGELVVALNGISAQAAGVPRDATTVEFPVNRGVSVAWNAAARRARGQALCVINDDVSLGPRSLRLLHSALLDDPDAGVVGPVT
jgi:GT2 family glycosyltransferase